MRVVMHEDTYLFTPGDGKDIKDAYSYLSVLKDMSNQGFKFIIPNGCQLFTKWLDERKIPYSIIGVSYDETLSFKAVAEIKEQKFNFVIVQPPLPTHVVVPTSSVATLCNDIEVK